MYACIINVCMYTRMYKFTNAYNYVCMHVSALVCMCVSVYMYVCIHKLHMYICMFVRLILSVYVLMYLHGYTFTCVLVESAHYADLL